MKKEVKKRNKIKSCIKPGLCLTLEEINKNILELKTDLEKIDYLKKTLINPDFLRENVKKKVLNMLGEIYIQNGLEKDAGKLFKEAGDISLAKECYETSNFFNKKDQELLNKKKKELNRIKHN